MLNVHKQLQLRSIFNNLNKEQEIKQTKWFENPKSLFSRLNQHSNLSKLSPFPPFLSFFRAPLWFFFISKVHRQLQPPVLPSSMEKTPLGNFNLLDNIAVTFLIICEIPIRCANLNHFQAWNWGRETFSTSDLLIHIVLHFLPNVYSLRATTFSFITLKLFLLFPQVFLRRHVCVRRDRHCELQGLRCEGA